MSSPIFLVDAFTPKPFAGNPAGVCLLSEQRDKPWRQAVAAEVNASETAFLVKANDGYDLSWFTPSTEIELCGHATLASAHILWQEKLLGTSEQARFHTLSGVLTADRRGEWIELDFPADPIAQCDSSGDLCAALGVTAKWVGRARQDYLVLVESESIVRELQPNHAALASGEARTIIVTAPGDASEYDFVSRFFAPGVGISEDPVTGSAHCRLGPFWQERLGKDEFVAYQASARGGVLRVRVRGKRIGLGGKAVTIMRGEVIA